MKAEELRIRNWVLDNRGCYVQVYSITSEINNDDMSDLYKPITLTEEILVKFGAKRVKPRTGIQKAFMLGSIRINLSNSGNFYYKNNVYNAVHEIQNLYYCIEKEELTIKLD